MIRLVLIWCVVIFIVFPITLYGQNDFNNSAYQLENDIKAEHLMEEGSSIEGVVYENDSQKPLSGANVILIENDTGSTTNIFGKFKFEDIKSGNYTLRVSFVGFETQEINLVVSENEISRITINLQTSALELSDIIISPGNQLKSRNTINAVDIQLRPINNSQKVLNIIPGIFTAQHAGGGKAEQIFLRGFDIDHGTDINLSLDGIPVNLVSHAHGQGYSDLHFIIPETISQVDFNKGPYYSNKGNFTTAGYAAYQTMSSIKKSKITVESGQFNTFRTVAVVDILGSEKSHNAYVASEYMITDGYFNSSQDFNRINLFAKYNNNLSDNKILNASLSTFKSSWDASGQIPQRAIDQGIIDRFGAIDDTEGGETNRTNLNLEMISSLDNGAIHANQIYFVKYDFKLYSNFTFFLNDPVNGDQIYQREDRNVYGYKSSYKIESELGNKSLLSEIGGGFRYDDINDIGLFHTMNRRTVIEQFALGQIDELNLDAYIDETIRLTPDFRINAGLRFDHHRYSYVDDLSTNYNRQSVTKNVLSPKLNLNYTFTPNLEVYVKSGIGYHSNDTRVVVAREGEEILPKAYGTDFGIHFKPSDRLLVNIATWILELEQEFVYVGDEAIVEPSGRTKRLGVDFSSRYQFTDWLFADMDLNLTRARSLENPDGENYIPLAPSLISKGGLTFNGLNGLDGSLRYRYIDDRPANEDDSVIAEGHLIFDVVLKYNHNEYQIGFSIENLFNQKWNEAQFDTESRLRNETMPVSEIHFTPGTPFFFKAEFTYSF